MNFEALIERRHAEARLELSILFAKAREEMQRKFAFINRSRGQRARYERTRIQRSGTA